MSNMTAFQKTLRLLRWLVTALFLLLLLVVLCGSYARYTGGGASPRPGLMVDLGDHSLHLSCSGEGEQTVVLESGGGSWSLDWFRVVEEIAPFARVCAYDRAGFGWSEQAWGSRDFQTLVNELDSLLEVAEVPGPYHLVGASLGAAIVQLYAQQNPQKVAGILLLDGRGRRSVSDLLALEPSLLPSGSMIGAARILGSLNIIDGLVQFTGTEGLLAAAHPNLDSYPAAVSEVFRDPRILARNLRATLAEASADALSEEQLDGVSDLGGIPLLVVRHGYENRFDALPLTVEKRKELEQEWIRQQFGLAALSTESRLLVAEESGHLIQLEQPSLVAELVAELLGVQGI